MYVQNVFSFQDTVRTKFKSLWFYFKLSLEGIFAKPDLFLVYISFEELSSVPHFPT